MSSRWLITLALLVTGCGYSPEAGTASDTSTSTAGTALDRSFPSPTPSPGTIAAATERDLTANAALASPAEADGIADTGDRDANAALPADVTAFRARRDQCDHFRGEEAGDAVRAAQLLKAVNRTCRGTDAQLIALRGKYAKDKTVNAALADYESEIE